MWHLTFLVLCLFHCTWARFVAYFDRYLKEEWFALTGGRVRHTTPDAPCLRSFDADPRLLTASGGSLWGGVRRMLQQLKKCSFLGGRYVIFAPALLQSRAWRLEAPPRRSHVFVRLHGPQDAQLAVELSERLGDAFGAPKPAWYLQPSNWKSRPSRHGFTPSSLTLGYFDRMWGMWSTRLQVNSRQRTVMCAIPKVGLSQFYMLMQRIGLVNASYSDFADPNLRFADRVVAWFASHDYWRDVRWKFIVFVRDPLERFLSAFNDKCLQPSTHCGVDVRQGWANVTLSSSLHEKVRAFRLFVAVPIPTRTMLQNDHWILQSLYLLYGCQFTWQRVDFVGLMSSDQTGMNFQVRMMLHNILGFSWAVASSMAESYFPSTGFASEHAAKHHKINRGQAARTFQTFYSHKDTLHKVLRYVRQDYIAFGLPLPRWAADLVNASWERWGGVTKKGLNRATCTSHSSSIFLCPGNHMNSTRRV
ncbi:unnamed protein product [Durusdinium trenchii]|uniref:Sulfotransferase domain-containing protein n=1 Tax=Durusdinium trenchii TaxID=1381693 RepID=A0ABP0S4Q3_9DINO